VWDRAGLPFIAEAFEWNSAKVPEGWEYVQGWHRDAVASTGIRKDDTDPDETFAAVADAEHLKAYLAHHQVFYEKLKAEAQA
ncbi:MAG: hypothetical protein ACR2OM_07970, partial [Aestuariivirgaceae bacterium]